MESTTTRRERWSPWWAIVLTVLALIPPGRMLLGGVLAAIDDFSGRSGFLGGLGLPMVLIGLIAVAPGVDYLVRRDKIAFGLALVVGIGFLFVFGAG